MAADLSDALTILKQLLLEPWESQYLINKPLLFLICHQTLYLGNWGFLYISSRGKLLDIVFPNVIRSIKASNTYLILFSKSFKVVANMAVILNDATTVSRVSGQPNDSVKQKRVQTNFLRSGMYL